MERKPFRQQHDFDRNEGHSSPRQLPEERQRDAREHIGSSGAAAFEYRRAGAGHVRRLRIISGQFQCVVGLDRAAHVEVATVVQGPSAVNGLMTAQIRGKLVLQRSVDLVQEVHHHDVLGRNRAVRLQLEQPVTLRTLLCGQGIARGEHRPVQNGSHGGFRQRMRHDVRTREGA